MTFRLLSLLEEKVCWAESQRACLPVACVHCLLALEFCDSSLVRDWFRFSLCRPSVSPLKCMRYATICGTMPPDVYTTQPFEAVESGNVVGLVVMKIAQS